MYVAPSVAPSVAPLGTRPLTPSFLCFCVSTFSLPPVYLQSNFSLPSVYLQSSFNLPSVYLQSNFSLPSVYLQSTFSLPDVKSPRPSPLCICLLKAIKQVYNVYPWAVKLQQVQVGYENHYNMHWYNSNVWHVEMKELALCERPSVVWQMSPTHTLCTQQLSLLSSDLSRPL